MKTYSKLLENKETKTQYFSRSFTKTFKDILETRYEFLADILNEFSIEITDHFTSIVGKNQGVHIFFTYDDKAYKLYDPAFEIGGFILYEIMNVNDKNSLEMFTDVYLENIIQKLLATKRGILKLDIDLHDSVTGTDHGSKKLELDKKIFDTLDLKGKVKLLINNIRP